MTTDYDYTRDDVPYGGPSESDIDNFELPDTTAPKSSADQLEADNSFEIPPGDHTLVVTGFRGMPEEHSFTVIVDGQVVDGRLVGGRTVSYRSATVKVRFGLPFNPKKNVEDFFVLPPANPAELDAYYRGIPTDAKPGAQGGLAASKFYHFMSRLGFPYPPGGKLPDAARRLGNWKGRAIRATVEPGTIYTDREGNKKMGYSRIKFWSYKAAGQSQEQGPGQSAGNGNGGSGRANQAGAPAMAGVSAGSSNPVGLDNV